MLSDRPSRDGISCFDMMLIAQYNSANIIFREFTFYDELDFRVWRTKCMDTSVLRLKQNIPGVKFD